MAFSGIGMVELKTNNGGSSCVQNENTSLGFFIHRGLTGGSKVRDAFTLLELSSWYARDIYNAWVFKSFVEPNKLCVGRGDKRQILLGFAGIFRCAKCFNEPVFLRFYFGKHLARTSFQDAAEYLPASGIAERKQARWFVKFSAIVDEL